MHHTKFDSTLNPRQIVTVMSLLTHLTRNMMVDEGEHREHTAIAKEVL